jgi:3-dehydroquinate dehydratase-2
MTSILVLNGPNLNLLGSREPEFYGGESLDDINKRLKSRAKSAGYALNTFQSNAENELIDRLHAAAKEDVGYILFNPAAFTHTSVALRDAILAVAIPFIEIHLSNIFARESFRAHSHFSDIAIGVITGLGSQSYELALEAAIARMKQKNT